MVSVTPSTLLDGDSSFRRSRLDRRALVAVGLLLIGIGVGVVFVLRFGAAEAEGDLRAWQDRLGIVIESRLEAVDGWVEVQYGTLEDLAANTALKLYMTQLALAIGETDDVADEPAERSYLRHLLVATVDQAGFTGPISGPEIDANVTREGSAGIALLDAAGRILVATPGLPAIDAKLDELIRTTPKGARGLIDVYAGLDGAATMGFMAPVVALQSDGGEAAPIGYVVGVKLIEAELFPRLKQPGATDATAEALLVRQEDGAVRFISPTAGGMSPLERTLALDTPGLAEASALATPGGFAIKRDYRDVEVLATSRKVAGVPWLLIYKVDREEALAESDARRQRLLIAFFLIIGVVSATLIAVWFHASSRRAGEAAARFRTLAQRYDRQQRFLTLVTDSQPNDISIVDEKGVVRYGNRTLATAVKLEPTDLIGKTLGSLFGPIAARRIEDYNRRALDTSTAVTDIHRVEGEKGLRIMQSVHIPLSEAFGMPRSVLLVSDDITEAVTEREKRIRSLRDLIGTLLGVVDRRDPYSANHSVYVAEVARAIAEEINLDASLVETVDIAGSLMNLGKIFVPAELLTANRPLTAEERKQIHASVLTSADLLAGVSFEGPVEDTLRQMLENVDGTGEPLVLKGEEILRTARVCAVANAFVSLVSDRAYRPKLTMDAAIGVLLGDSGKKYDRGVVAALINRLDNHGGRTRWAAYGLPAGRRSN